MPGEGQAAPFEAHPVGALQAQAAPLMAQPSDSLSQQAHPSQGERPVLSYWTAAVLSVSLLTHCANTFKIHQRRRCFCLPFSGPCRWNRLLCTREITPELCARERERKREREGERERERESNWIFSQSTRLYRWPRIVSNLVKNISTSQSSCLNSLK